VGEVGQTVNGFIDRVSSGSGIAAVGVQALLGQTQQSLGLDIRRDLLAWMGDAGLFVAGDSGSDTRAALVVASKDAAATRRAVSALGTLARRSAGADVSALHASGVDAGFAVHRPGQRQDLLVAAAGDRFVVATGQAALTEALSPGARLGDAPAFRDAASKLGGDVRPSFFVDLQRLSKRAGSKGGSHDHAREYLDAFGALVGGSRRDGDVSRGAAVATLP
jgi:hypothetical protein